MNAASQTSGRVSYTQYNSPYVPGGIQAVGMEGMMPEDYFDYIDDGPQKAGEDYPTYRNRVIRSRLYMKIQRRPVVLPPITPDDFPNRQAYDKFMKQSKFVQRTSRSNVHRNKMKPKSKSFDEEYVRQWKEQKGARHAWNTNERVQAHQRKVQAFAAAGLPRPPTPSPPEDSGDELLDPDIPDRQPDPAAPVYSNVRCEACALNHFGCCNIQEIGIPCTRCTQSGRECKYHVIHRKPIFSKVMCKQCDNSRVVCDIRKTGIPPCSRCIRLGIKDQCEFKRLKKDYEGGSHGKRDDSNTAAPTTGRSRQRTSQPRRRRSASPPRGPEADPVPNPCTNCVRNARTCTISRPCNPCMLYNERHLCDAVHQGHDFATSPVGDEDYGMLGMDFEGVESQMAPGGVPQGQQQGGISPEEQMLYNSLYDAIEAADRGPFDLPVSPMGFQPASDPAPYVSLPEVQYCDNNARYLQPQPHDVQRAVLQASRERRRSPDQELRNAASVWEVRQRADTATPDRDSMDLFQFDQGGDESFQFSDFLNDGMTLPFQHGDDTDMGMPDVWADNMFSGMSVQAPDIPLAEGGLAEPVLPNYAEQRHASVDLNDLGPEPPNTPVLPGVNPIRNSGDELLSIVSYCSELFEYFVPGAARRNKCGQTAGKKCDEFSHGEFCTCSRCHMDQNNYWRVEQDRIVDLTKVYMCKPCADDARRTKRGHSNTNVQLSNCLCVGQMKKSWLCHVHREAAIKAVKIRVGLVGEWLTRNKRGICWCCEQRPEDRSTEAWRCKGCREQVVLSVY
jgi:hypothetical protein